jgi:hypothetical protein
LNVLEYLIRANETPLDVRAPHDCNERLSFQRKAMTELVIIGYIAVMAMEQKCILAKQCEQISGLVTDCRNLLGGWMNSDKKRISGGNSSLLSDFTLLFTARQSLCKWLKNVQHSRGRMMPKTHVGDH